MIESPLIAVPADVKDIDGYDADLRGKVNRPAFEEVARRRQCRAELRLMQPMSVHRLALSAASDERL